ncbi:unnamed protein product [Pseudo-nitzschia multistriata]|uniref:Secreted protein n=1 Tax=Pseudo-nitzschia multistriata TaxID=183589 RepID=A0A448ZPQ3_9STRA|nr:unnamed protein product [Pseudo-nitzschia multistriata]
MKFRRKTTKSAVGLACLLLISTPTAEARVRGTRRSRSLVNPEPIIATIASHPDNPKPPASAEPHILNAQIQAEAGVEAELNSLEQKPLPSRDEVLHGKDTPVHGAPNALRNKNLHGSTRFVCGNHSGGNGCVQHPHRLRNRSDSKTNSHLSQSSFLGQRVEEAETRHRQWVLKQRMRTPKTSRTTRTSAGRHE